MCPHFKVLTKLVLLSAGITLFLLVRLLTTDELSSRSVEAVPGSLQPTDVVHLDTCGEQLISEVSLHSYHLSPWLRPRKLSYTKVSTGRKTEWFFVQSLDVAVALVYDESADELLFVKQFRAPVWFASLKEDSDSHTHAANNCTETGKKCEEKATAGMTLEVCGGYVDDPKLSAKQTIRKEIEEELGYRIAEEQTDARIQSVMLLRTDTGLLGRKLHLFYATVNDSLRSEHYTHGNEDEGEEITIVRLKATELMAVLRADNDHFVVEPSTATLILWYLLNAQL